MYITLYIFPALAKWGLP